MVKNIKLDDLVISKNGNFLKEFNIGAKTYVKVKKGDKFKIVKKTNGELFEEEVIVQKSSDDLILSYQDGSTVIFESFYNSESSIELPASNNGVLTLDSTMQTNDGLVYAYGDKETLLSMSDVTLHSSISEMSDFSQLPKFAEASSVGTDASIANSSTVSLSTTALSSLALVGIVVASTGSGGGSSSQTPVSVAKKNGLLLDSVVSGVDYYINGQFVGKTKSDGSFEYQDGDRITFKIGNITLGELTQVPPDGRVLPQDLAGVDRGNFTNPLVVTMARILQTLDSDGNVNNGIDINDLSKLQELQNTTLDNNTDVTTLFDSGVQIVDKNSAIEHLKDTISTFMEVDRTPPTTPTATLTTDSGTVGDNITNVAGLTFNALEAGATRTFRVDGVDASSYVPPTTDGEHTVIVTDTDVAGNVSTVTKTFTLDTTNPTTPTATLTTDSGLNTDNITNVAGLIFSSLEAGATRTFRVDGVDASSYVPPTTDGEHTVIVTDTDVAGNVSTVTKTFTLDKTLNITSTTTGTPIVENSGASQVIYTASSDESGSVVYGLKDGGDKSLLTIDATNGKVTLTANPDFETKSTYNFTVTATDIAGNVSEKDIVLNINDVRESSIINGTSSDDVINYPNSLNYFTINSLLGNDTITTSGENDIIRAGEGLDTVNSGAGNDIIVVVGTTSTKQYTQEDITNAGDTGIDLSSVVTLADLNGRVSSEIVSGESIDGGSGTNRLIIYGDVDLSGVNLANVTQIQVNSTLTLTAQQLNALPINLLFGDGESTLNITNSGTDPISVDLSGKNLSDFKTINIGQGVTLISDQSDISTYPKLISSPSTFP